MCALFLPPTAWPEALLQTAWLQLVRNAAHDSVCACSVDEVCSAVVHRYAEARQIGEGLADRAGRALAASMAEPGVVVVNPSARGRGGVVQLDMPGEGPVTGAQVLGERGAVLADFSPPLDELTMLLSALRSQQIDDRTFINRVDTTPMMTSATRLLPALIASSFAGRFAAAQSSSCTTRMKPSQLTNPTAAPSATLVALA